MKANTVTVDRSVTPTKLTYSDVFNVAVPMVDRHVEEGRGDRVFIKTVEEEVTYGQLAERVNRAGNAIRALGIEPGERMLMVVKDCPEFIYLVYGAIKAGVIPVCLNTLLRSGDYTYMIDDSKASMFVYSPEYAAEVEAALDAAEHKPKVAIRTEGDPGDVDGFVGKMTAASDRLDPYPATVDTDCFWLYSSGSTGRPKGTVHQHNDVIENAEHYAVGILGLTEDDVGFSAAKLFFAYGFGNSLNFVLWTGGGVVLSDRVPSPDMTFEVVEQFRPTVYYGVPTLYAAQLRAMETASPDLSSLRLSVSAGEALPADIFRRWKEKTGSPPIDGIGSTEATHIFISNRPDDAKAGTSGKLFPGYDAKIVDDDGNEVTQGDVGRLLVKGGSIAGYYWNKPDRSANTFIDGWLNTGDTYYQDEDGYYVYCGRSDDMIKVGGIWCSPIEIEARLIEHPKVLEAGVVGRDDDDGLVKPEAWIILNEASDAGPDLEQELLEHCKSGLARYKYPRWFHFVEDLPKTATGKIQRFKLRA